MNFILKNILAVIALWVFVFSLVVPGTAQQDQASFKAKWAETLEGAKKEGTVTLYGGAEITHPQILKVFEKRYPGIKVVTVSGHSELILRIDAERRARKYLADIFSYGPNAARTAYLANYLQPLAPHLMLPDVNDMSAWYKGQHFYRDPKKEYIFLYEGTPGSSSIAYNTKKLTDLKGIQSYWDILDPKWRGKIGFFSYGGGSSIPTPMLTLYYNPKVGRKFIQRLFTEMDLTISKNRRQATDWLGRGKYPLCFMCRDIERAKRQGLPVETFPADKIKESGQLGGGNSSVIAFLKDAPHPNAAKIFFNWFLSKEGQMTWQEVMNTVVLEGSDSMRIDIPKDNVLAADRRVAGKDYPMLEFLDPRPVSKLYWKLMAQALERKKRQ